MAIIYYPNRIYKSKVPVIDTQMSTRNTKIVRGFKDASVTALDETVSVGGD